jgi:hypothetical protein
MLSQALGQVLQLGFVEIEARLIRIGVDLVDGDLCQVGARSL